MSKATLQQSLVWQGIEAINRCVERLPMNEAHEAISKLREHLEARAEQTRPVERRSELGLTVAEDAALERRLDAAEFYDLLGV